jgi:hypothetical protein
MNLLQKRMWKIESIPVYDYISGSYGDVDLIECIDVVISTKDIPKEQMLTTLVWNSFIQTFHINGLTTYIARYLAKAHGIDYSEFYDAFYQHIQNDSWMQQQFTDTHKYYELWTTTGLANHPRIGNVEVTGQNLMHRITLNMQLENKIDHVFDIIDNFVRTTYTIDSNILEQLLQFQRNYVIDYKDLPALPIQQKFDYDFLGYLLDNSDITTTCMYQFDTNEDKTMGIERFLENMYFGRKRNFGKTTITKTNSADLPEIEYDNRELITP